jgi:hypothetical protein
MSTRVLFFGGYKASPSDMQNWQNSAQAQRKDVDFRTSPWPPGANSGEKSAVSHFGSLDKLIADIESSSADLIYIVGHSSGCAIANAVDRGLKDHTKIVLIALDGFVPNKSQLARRNTQCWGAVCGDKKSRNYESMRRSGRLQVFKATDCKTEWALHFSLVNAAANDKLVTSVATGYTNCMANLVWLTG